METVLPELSRRVPAGAKAASSAVEGVPMGDSASISRCQVKVYGFGSAEWPGRLVRDGVLKGEGILAAGHVVGIEIGKFGK
eukprot:5448093-Pleurochrysis_carterae.AAC.1